MWPTGGTPPIANPVLARTKSARARSTGPTNSAQAVLVDPVSARRKHEYGFVAGDRPENQGFHYL